MGPRFGFDEKEEMGSDATILNAGNNTPKKQTPETWTSQTISNNIKNKVNYLNVTATLIVC